MKDVSPAQLDTRLARHRARIKRLSLNAYIVFLRQVFSLAISARALAESPAAGLKMLKPEEPICDTPTWAQFREIVEEIRRQKLNDDAVAAALSGQEAASFARCLELLRAVGDPPELACARYAEVIEARKAVAEAGRGPGLYFWRSHDGLEVDLLVESGAKLIPIEIKQTATPMTLEPSSALARTQP